RPRRSVARSKRRPRLTDVRRPSERTELAMRDLNEDTLTQETLNRLQGTADPRVRQISEALVRHLHAFVREVEPTQDEWAWGIDFLTRVGKMCDDKRQEFILLSDV